MRSGSVSKLVLVSVALVTACGRIGYENIARDGGPDGTMSNDGGGGTDGDTTETDGAVAEARCDWSLGPPAFGAVEHLETVNGASADFDSTVSRDGLTLYFVSRRDGDEDIFVSTRDMAGVLEDPSPYDEVNSTVEDTRFVLSADGREAFVTSLRTGTLGVADIFRATRSDTSLPFASFASVPLVSTTTDEFDPFLSDDGLSLYFAPLDRGVGVGQQVFVATRASIGSAFDAGEAVPVINSPSDETDPSLTRDGRVIVFGSSRSGTMRVYYATRESALLPFGAPTLLPQLATGPAAIDPFLSGDGCALYFSSIRADTLGAEDLYRISAPTP